MRTAAFFLLVVADDDGFFLLFLLVDEEDNEDTEGDTQAEAGFRFLELGVVVVVVIADIVLFEGTTEDAAATDGAALDLLTRLDRRGSVAKPAATREDEGADDGVTAALAAAKAQSRLLLRVILYVSAKNSLQPATILIF